MEDVFQALSAIARWTLSGKYFAWYMKRKLATRLENK
jgi:hypothetical protein